MKVDPGLTLKSFFSMILKDESVVATKAMTIQASLEMPDFSEPPLFHPENSQVAFEALYVSA
jgi:hypothetical protein